MATAVDAGAAGRPPLPAPGRRVRSRDHGPALLRRALKNSGSALRMRVSWQAPRLLTYRQFADPIASMLYLRDRHEE